MTTYKAGSVVSYGGGLWYAQSDASGMPGADTAWKLMVQGGTSGADSDIYRATGIQAGGAAGSGGATFGIENHGYGANQHSGIYVSEGQLYFTAVDDNNGSNTEWTQDNRQFNYYVTDATGTSHTLLEMGVDSAGAPYARILGTAVGGSPLPAPGADGNLLTAQSSAWVSAPLPADDMPSLVLLFENQLI